MALTDTERSQIRKYLGFPGRFYQLDTELESAMSVLNGTEDEDRVREELARCIAIDAELDALLGSVQDVIQAGSTIQLRPAMQLQLIRNRGRQAVGRISAVLAVKIRSDAFGTGGYLGSGNLMAMG